MRNFPQMVEERIRRTDRRGRRIRIDESDAMAFRSPGETDERLRPQALVWNAHYVLGQKFARTGVSTAISSDTLTLDTTDSGTGAFSIANLTWTDGGATWTPDQWQDYYLKVDSQYYKILSNTGTVLTLDLIAGECVKDAAIDTAYDIVAFIPKSLIGAFLNPDTADTQRFKILDNTETAITIETVYLLSGVVTTGDAGAPYIQFEDTSIQSYADDRFNGMSVHFTSGDNEGEIRNISDFQSSGGTIILSATTTNTIDVDDEYDIIQSLLYVDVSDTWRIERYYTIDDTDFSGADPEDLRSKSIFTDDGELKDNNLPPNYAGVYSVEILSNAAKSFIWKVQCPNSLRIELTELSDDNTEVSTLVLHDSGFRANKQGNVSISMLKNVWYRLDVYIYVEDGSFGIQAAPLRPYIYEWRDVTPGIPQNVSVPLTNTAAGWVWAIASIPLSWTPNWRFGSGGLTEIWRADMYLAYDGGIVDFILGDVIIGNTSGADGRITEITGDTVSGILKLRTLNGTFQNDEEIKVLGVTHAFANNAEYAGSYAFLASVSGHSDHYEDMNTGGASKSYRLRHVAASGIYGLYSTAAVGRSYEYMGPHINPFESIEIVQITSIAEIG